MQKTIQEGGRDGHVAQDLSPGGDRTVGSHDRRGFGVPLRYDLEQGRGALGGQRQVPQFVNLCGYRHRLTYADTATTPMFAIVGCRSSDDSGFPHRAAPTGVGIVSG